MHNYTVALYLSQQIQVTTYSIQDELYKLEPKMMMHRVNVEQLEDSMKLLEKNLEEFKLEMMVCIYVCITSNVRVTYSIIHPCMPVYICTVIYWLIAVLLQLSTQKMCMQLLYKWSYLMR